MYSGTLNGHSHNGKSELQAKRRERRLLEETNAIAVLKHRKKLIEYWDSQNWATDYLRVLSRRHGNEGAWVPISNRSDRRRGMNYPLVTTEMELALLRGPSRILCQANTYAKGLLRALRSFVINVGFTYKAVPKFDGVNKKLVAKVQDKIDDFCERERWKSWERELFLRSRRDGEYFLRHFVDGSDVSVRSVEPEQVCQPTNKAQDWTAWTFGIRCAEDDIQTPVAYWVAYQDSATVDEGEEVSVDEMVHFKANVDRAIKRGIPDFIAGTFDALQMADKLQVALGTGAAIQASVAGVRQHEGYSAEQVSDFRSGQRDYTVDESVTGKQQSFEQHFPGEFWDIPKGMNFVAPPGAANAVAHIEVLSSCCRSAAAAWNAPEWLVSASAANMGAYTSSLVAESPFVIGVKAEQEEYKYAFLRTMRIVVQAAIDAGELPAETLDVIKLTAEPPEIEHRDKLQEAQTNQIYVMLGATSRQKVAQSLGNDWDEITQENEDYQNRMGAGQQLPMPWDNPFGGGQMDMGGGGMPAPKMPQMPRVEEIVVSQDRVRTESGLTECDSGECTIDLPDVRQDTDYSCGAAAVTSVCRYFGKEPDTEGDAIRQLGTSPRDGTDPEHIIAVLQDHGLETVALSGMGLDDLEAYTGMGRPVICCVQMWPDEVTEDKSGGGRWITIGGRKGEDGKRSGGSPVYIENGKITKGHPSLTGKKIGSLKDDAEPTSHRKELNQSKNYEKAFWSKKARKEGINPSHLHSLADELRAHDKAFVDERNEFLKEARGRLSAHSGQVKVLQTSDHFDDPDKVKGLDQVAGDMANNAKWAHHFEQDGDHASRLYDLLREGKPEPMSHADSYSQAFDHFMNERMSQPKADEWDFPVPKGRTESRDASGHEHGSDGRFSATGGGSHSANIGRIPEGEGRHVAGYFVRNIGGRFQIQTDKHEINGSPDHVAKYIADQHESRKHLKPMIDAALDRADKAHGGTFFGGGTDHETGAFERIPHGEPVVSLAANTYGRLGKIVDRDGKKAVKLDGTPGYASADVEPLDKKWSWRARQLGQHKDKPRESAAVQKRFFESGDWQSQNDNGHYIVVASVRDSVVHYHDPVSGPSSMPGAEFMQVWHDTDMDGNPYVRYGIAVKGPRPEPKAESREDGRITKLLAEVAELKEKSTPVVPAPVVLTPAPVNFQIPPPMAKRVVYERNDKGDIVGTREEFEYANPALRWSSSGAEGADQSTDDASAVRESTDAGAER